MTVYRYHCAWQRALLGLLMLLTVPLMAGRAAAQGASQTVFEAPLLIQINGQSVPKGTVLATLDGQALRLFGAFDGLSAPWVQADLYRGDPVNGGQHVENLAILIAGPFALGGGFDKTVALTQALVEDLQNGDLYVTVHMASADPNDALHGQIQLSPAAEPGFMETPLSHFWQGHPVARGSLRALRTTGGLRLIGFFHGLASNWQVIALYRGAHGAAGEHITSIFNNPPPMAGLYAGFDFTFALEEGWEQDLLDGLFAIEVQPSRTADKLRGQILPTQNQAPEASQMIWPADGATVVIGGTGGADPVDPDVYLGTIAFTPVDDPDSNPVAYLWQAALRPDFSHPDQTITLDLGVDSTRIDLTVADAAALFDALSGRQPGHILLDTPVTLYHRVVTTDGSRYTLGATAQATFVRGTITANEPIDGLPGLFTLHGNYPNPFNPTTTITFDLPAQAEVHVEVFNLLGQRVLTVPVGPLAAGAAHRVEVDGAALPSGSYLYRVVIQRENTAQAATGAMLLLK